MQKSTTMEWVLIHKSVTFSLLSLLMVSTIFFLHTLFTSKSNSTFISKEDLTTQNKTVIQMLPHYSQFEGDEEEACDFSVGRWVRDTKGPMYTNRTCATLPVLKNCLKHGKDPNFMYWSWKPHGCDLPKFEPLVFMNILHGKKLAFIGDSLARNQMESLLCLLSQVETPVNKFKDQEDKFQTWHFPSYNFTVMVMWTEFLVESNERINNGTPTNQFNIHLDKMNTKWTKNLPGLHFAIISSSNWFFRTNFLYKDGNLIGCIFCNEGNLTNLGPIYAIKHAFKTTLGYIHACKECEGLVTLVRTYSPSHFEHGSWFTGGYCNRTQPLSDGEVDLGGNAMKIRDEQVKEIERIERVRGVGKRRFVLMDVTKAMVFRADGHPGSHWLRVRNVNDCLHWCLPGPVDMWNDLLMDFLIRLWRR